MRLLFFFNTRPTGSFRDWRIFECSTARTQLMHLRWRVMLKTVHVLLGILGSLVKDAALVTQESHHTALHTQDAYLAIATSMHQRAIQSMERAMVVRTSPMV